MAAVWVAEFNGSLLVRADTITTIKSETMTNGTALVSVKTMDGTSLLVKKARVTAPGDTVDTAAVRQEAKSMALELVQQITQAELQAQQASYFRVLDFSDQQEPTA